VGGNQHCPLCTFSRYKLHWIWRCDYGEEAEPEYGRGRRLVGGAAQAEGEELTRPRRGAWASGLLAPAQGRGCCRASLGPAEPELARRFVLGAASSTLRRLDPCFDVPLPTSAHSPSRCDPEPALPLAPNFWPASLPGTLFLPLASSSPSPVGSPFSQSLGRSSRPHLSRSGMSPATRCPWS
jgi:hypothetical protein